MTWYLETDRLRLRAIDGTDAQNMYELNRDPEVMTYLSTEFDTLRGAQEILPKVVARNEKYGNQLGLFAAIEKETEAFIGWFILRPERVTPDDTTNLEIGYRLNKRHWGKGYGTEASRALMEKARAQFGARRLFATAMPGNRASIRIMEKLGLRLEKTYTEIEASGKGIDLVLYSLELT